MAIICILGLQNTTSGFGHVCKLCLDDSMGKPKKKKKTFNYNKDRKRVGIKSKKMPTIHCTQIRKAWDEKKSMLTNLEEMGLSANPNKTLRIPTAMELLGPRVSCSEDAYTINKKGKKKQSKLHVVKELEEEAAIPPKRLLKLSEPEVAYCIHMMEKYGNDFKAMAMDEENYYQDTPKQIERKIKVFKSIPEQFSAYLASKAVSS